MATTPTTQLASIGIEETTDPGAKALVLTDDSGNESTFIVGPEGLSEVLQELLGLAAHWSAFDPAAARELSGVVPASDFQIGQGQDPTEGVLMVHVGPVQLGFAIPSQTLLQRVQEFAKRVRLVPLGPVQ